MIVKWLLAAVGGLLSVLDALIPETPMPDIADSVDMFATIITGYAFALNGILPISELAIFAGWTLGVYAPAAITYATVRWLYAHIPFLNGGGS